VIYLVLVACPGLVGAIWPSATLAMLMLGGTSYLGLLWVTRLPRQVGAQGSPNLI
jgi:hypothetical protein